MGTSEHGGTILYDTGDFDTDEPIDTVLVRDSLINSALHKADEAAQVRMNWVGIEYGGSPLAYREIGDRDGSVRIATTGANGSAWYAFPLRAQWYPKIRSDGTGYRLRVRLAGKSSGGDRVDFALVVAPKGLYTAGTTIQAQGSNPIGAVKYYTNETSTTAAWLTPDDGTHYLDVGWDFIQAALAEGQVSTREDIGGAFTTVQAPILEASIWGQTFNSGSRPRLYGAYIADYIGQ